MSFGRATGSEAFGTTDHEHLELYLLPLAVDFYSEHLEDQKVCSLSGQRGI